MNALKLIQKSQDRQLVIDLPDEFANAELEIIILRTNGNNSDDVMAPMAQPEALAVARSFFGIAKSDTTFSEEDFYTQ